MFVEYLPVTLVDDETNPIAAQNSMTLRSKLTLGQDAALLSDVQSQQRERGTNGLSVATWQVLLLKHHLVTWNGPAFRSGERDIPCTHDSVLRLDPDEPLVKRALERVWELHFGVIEEEADPDPKGQSAPTHVLSDSLPAGSAG